MKTARFEFVKHRGAEGSSIISQVFHECIHAINEAEFFLFDMPSGDMQTIYRQVSGFLDHCKAKQNGSRYYIDIKVEMLVREFGGKNLQYIAIKKHNGLEMWTETYKGTKRINQGKPEVELLAEIVPNT